MVLAKRRKKEVRINPKKLMLAGTILLWLATACFFYFIPPKSNLIISLAFLLLFLCLFAPAFLLLKVVLAAFFLSLGLWLLLLFQFFSLLTLPLGLTTFFLAGLITLYVLLNKKSQIFIGREDPAPTNSFIHVYSFPIRSHSCLLISLAKNSLKLYN